MQGSNVMRWKICHVKPGKDNIVAWCPKRQRKQAAAQWQSRQQANAPLRVCVCVPGSILCLCACVCVRVCACVRAVSLPHLAAIRMCASVTAAKQHKCVAQMERRGWRTELVLWGLHKETVQNGKHGNETLPDSRGRLNDLVGVGRRRWWTKGARIYSVDLVQWRAKPKIFNMNMRL